MPRSHRPRKRYVPKLMWADPVSAAIDRVAVLQAGQRMLLNAPLLDAFTAFRAGQGSRAHWMTLADAMNVAEVIAERGLFTDDKPEAYASAQRLLAEISNRHEARHSWTLRAHEITTLDTAVQCHEIQLDSVSQGELADAINTVKRRVAEALRGNAGPGTTMCAPGLLGREPSAAHQPEGPTT